MADKFFTPDSLPAGTTSVSIPVKLVAESTGAGVTGVVAAGITASYWRQGGLEVAIADSDLAALDSVYSSGGWFEVSNGIYRLDVPDAAFADGADWVKIIVAETGSQPFEITIALPTYAILRTTLFSKIIEDQGSYTVQQALSLMLAALAGESSSAGSVRSTPNGSATRISATINASNERTAMTLTPSAGA